MPSNMIRKFKILAIICLFTSFAGVIFQLIGEERVDHNSVVLGFPLGLVFGLLELFLFPRSYKKFQKWSFTRIIIFKTLLYTIAIYIVTVILVIIAGLYEGRNISELSDYLSSTGQIVLVIYTLVIYSLLVLFMQINHLLGEGVLWKFITGKYHQPREEE